MWVEDLKCMHCFCDVKKKLFLDGCSLNIKQVEMGGLCYIRVNPTRLIY